MNSDFEELLKLFNENQVKYLIVGGVAFIFHAEPRYTKDLDIWVKPDKENAAAIYKSLRDFGAPLAGVTEDDFANSELFYQMGRPPGRIDILTPHGHAVLRLPWMAFQCCLYPRKI